MITFVIFTCLCQGRTDTVLYINKNKVQPSAGTGSYWYSSFAGVEPSRIIKTTFDKSSNIFFLTRIGVEFSVSGNQVLILNALTSYVRSGSSISTVTTHRGTESSLARYVGRTMVPTPTTFPDLSIMSTSSPKVGSGLSS
jgi:hypothetical protein